MYQIEGEVVRPNYRPIVNTPDNKGSIQNPINPHTDLDIYDYDRFRHNSNYIGMGKIPHMTTANDFVKPSMIPNYVNLRPSPMNVKELPEVEYRESTHRPVYGAQKGGQLPSYQTKGEYNASELPDYTEGDMSIWADQQGIANVYGGVREAFSNKDFAKIYVDQVREALEHGWGLLAWRF